MAKEFVKFFSELSIKDVPQVGGKNASLGEMYNKLSKKGVKIPNGFATTAYAYDYFLEKTGVKKQAQKILADLDISDVRDLMSRGKKIRELILAAEFPEDLKVAIRKAYKKLSAEYKTKSVDTAVRSSATAEDLPDASFAGQQETFLNVSGEDKILEAVKKCIASLFTNRAISYRCDKGFDHFKVALSVGVQKMIRSDLASSGIMFSIDTESGFENVVLINSIYGLGENIVQGKVTPDEFLIFKPTKKIISKKLGEKDIKMIYANTNNKTVKNIPVPEKQKQQFSITDEQAIKLANWGMIIASHYNRAMDMEWAIDGKTNEIYIIQARPETVHSTKKANILEEYILKEKGKIIITGQSVGNKIGTGSAKKIMSIKDIAKFKPGEVLVTDMTDPDWEPIMKIASAIVTDKGGRTCHAAIISREMGIPCIVGTNNGSKKIPDGKKITVNCSGGDEGIVYEGALKFEVKKIDIKDLKKPKTKIMMNIGSPEIAFASSFIPNDGVGLAREEFIINNYIKIHPLALINYPKVDAKTKKQIDELTIGYKDKKQFFIDKLAEGVAIIAAAFYPKEAIFRLSDFKTNEYANMIGGAAYEPKEENPMIGWRGASRYYSPKYKPAFELECLAFKKAREEMGLKNIKIMIPFCRTVEEGIEVKKILAKNGLKQGKDGLEIYVMAEIPSNIILAEEFAQEFNGFSIGSNDLTQLTLGMDRDSAILSGVAGVANEKNEAVKTLIQYLIESGKRTKTKVGICGQAPSDFSDFAQFLVELGIDSISLNPDTVIKTTMAILEQEKKIKK